MNTCFPVRVSRAARILGRLGEGRSGESLYFPSRRTGRRRADIDSRLEDTNGHTAENPLCTLANVSVDFHGSLLSGQSQSQ